MRTASVTVWPYRSPDAPRSRVVARVSSGFARDCVAASTAVRSAALARSLRAAAVWGAVWLAPLAVGATLTAAQWSKVLGANDRVRLGIIGPGDRGPLGLPTLAPIAKEHGVEVVIHKWQPSEAIQAAVRAAGAASIDVAVTHALFLGDALDQLRAAGVRHVWSTDAVPHASNVVSVAPLIARADQAMYAAKRQRVPVLTYEPQLDDRSTHTLSLLSELRYAIERKRAGQVKRVVVADDQEIVRKLQQHTAHRLANYRRELAPRAAAAAARSLPTIPPGSLAMVLRPHATKLLIPNSGPYLVTGSTRHTYLLRNIATGFAFSEHRSNVRAMSDTLVAFRARDAP